MGCAYAASIHRCGLMPGGQLRLMLSCFGFVPCQGNVGLTRSHLTRFELPGFWFELEGTQKFRHLVNNLTKRLNDPVPAGRLLTCHGVSMLKSIYTTSIYSSTCLPGMQQIIPKRNMPYPLSLQPQSHWPISSPKVSNQLIFRVSISWSTVFSIKEV